ncbi:hypothetical protein K435DRAFT_960352 [Dendrothele bispora CBS 962.96]|uniref:Transcription factor domain-containing protein n=1 Tax=Dendrothele bispora (strain CBS 962.96) TaxID=1314807 RepID=A0A4S8MWB9_DENBC|nr:hypothetical protein K435DRAFT_960352 [Dendrothele bispora CBS 962.96]
MSSNSSPPSQPPMLGSFSVQDTITVPVRERVRSSRACRLCRKQKTRCEGRQLIPIVQYTFKLSFMQEDTHADVAEKAESNACSNQQRKHLPVSPSERTTALESRMSTIEAELAQTKALLDRFISHPGNPSTSSPASIISPVVSKPHVASSPAASASSSSNSYPKIPSKPATPSGSLARILTSNEDEITSDNMVSKHQLPKHPLKRPRIDTAFEDPTSPTDINSLADNKECALAFVIFSRRCAAYIPFFDPNQPYPNFCQTTHSQLLYWSVIGTGSREAEELTNLHSVAFSRATKWVQASVYGPPCSLDDLKGLLIYVQWLATPRPTGHAVALAYELNLHKSGSHLVSLINEMSTATDSAHLRQHELAKAMDEVRTFSYLYVTDRLLSLASGKPPLMTEGDIPSELRSLVSLPTASPRDGRILAQVELLNIISQVKEEIIGAGSPTAPLNNAALELLRIKNNEADEWHTRWQAWAAQIDQGAEVFTMPSSISINYVWGKMQMNCLTLYGVKQASDFSPTRFQYLAEAVKFAIDLLQITFGAVFCLKIIRLLPGRFDENHILRLAVDTAVLMSFSTKSRQYHELLVALLEQFSTAPVSTYLRDMPPPLPSQLYPQQQQQQQPQQPSPQSALHHPSPEAALAAQQHQHQHQQHHEQSQQPLVSLSHGGHPSSTTPQQHPHPHPQYHYQEQQSTPPVVSHWDPSTLNNVNFWNWSQSMPVNGLDGFFPHQSLG